MRFEPGDRFFVPSGTDSVLVEIQIVGVYSEHEDDDYVFYTLEACDPSGISADDASRVSRAYGRDSGYAIRQSCSRYFRKRIDGLRYLRTQYRATLRRAHADRDMAIKQLERIKSQREELSR